MTSTSASVQQVHSSAGPLLDRAVQASAQAAADQARSVLADFETTVHRLFAEETLDATVAEVAALAGLRYDADAAGIIMLVRGKPFIPAGSRDPAAVGVDSLQVSGRQGPALQAIGRRQPVVVSDLRCESRWRVWAPLAADAGFRSVLSVPLADGDVVGALTLYSTSLSRFQPNILASASMFAHLASVAIAAAQKRQQLMEAVTSHAVVGQAQGILMDRYGVTADRAFAVLRRHSSHLNQKLRVIAEGVIRDGRLPELDLAEPRDARPTSTCRVG